MNPQIYLAARLARDLRDDDWRRADEWRRLHRRRDALPLPPEPDRGPSRWAQARQALRRLTGPATI
jgi:hypothetical protein